MVDASSFASSLGFSMFHDTKQAHVDTSVYLDVNGPNKEFRPST